MSSYAIVPHSLLIVLQACLRSSFARGQDVLSAPTEIQSIGDFEDRRSNRTFWFVIVYIIKGLSDLITSLDYLADSVDAFLTKEATSDYDSVTQTGETRDEVLLGLTFSFPVDQTALDSGKILTWTKGFAARNAIGHDVVKLLQDAFDRKHMHVKCVALVNDVGFTVYTKKCDKCVLTLDCGCPPFPRIRCGRLLAWRHFRNRD